MIKIQSSLKFQDLEAKTGRHQKLICILDTLEASALYKRLAEIRGDKGNGADNEVLFRSFMAFTIFGIRTISEGIRVLEEDRALREIVGIGAWGKIPSKDSFYRFQRRLSKESCKTALRDMFSELVWGLKACLPGFGKHLVGDSTKIRSYARGNKLSVDSDASWKKQKKVMKDKGGSVAESFESWFGYKAHILSDADYELPIGFVTTTAKHNDNTIFPNLWEKTKSEQPWILTDTKYVGLDMGYDDGKIYEQLSIADDLIPIIKMRDMVRPQNKDIDLSQPPVCGNNLPLTFDGYESKRKQIRYIKPTNCVGITCPFYRSCFIGVKRISIHQDPRKLVPIPRNTKKFERLNNKRTSIERINSRLKKHYNLDGMRRYGLGQTNLMVNLSLLSMNAFALFIAKKGKIKEVRKIYTALAA